MFSDNSSLMVEVFFKPIHENITLKTKIKRENAVLRQILT